MSIAVAGFASQSGPAHAAASCESITATIEGTSGDDHIRGTNGRDVIVAGSGSITDADGVDSADGGQGDDTCGRSIEDRRSCDALTS